MSIRFQESTNNLPVPIEKTVRELFDKCEKHRGDDGTANVSIRLGLLRRLADYLDDDFESVHGFVRKRDGTAARIGQGRQRKHTARAAPPSSGTE